MNESKEKTKGIWALGDYRNLGKIISPVSAQLINLCSVNSQDSVLDIACGFGNTAITARRKGAKVTGIDVTPELLEMAKQEEAIAGVTDIEWREGNAEYLPFEDESFDVVLSTFGHMFAPNQDLTAKEMIRVAKKGGRIGFATWPPELVIGRLFNMISKYNTLPSPSSPSPIDWGSHVKIQQLLKGVKDIFHERDTVFYPILSPNHYWLDISTKAGSMIKLLQTLREENKVEKIEQLKNEYIKTIEPYIKDNSLRMGYLLTIATKDGE